MTLSARLDGKDPSIHFPHSPLKKILQTILTKAATFSNVKFYVNDRSVSHKKSYSTSGGTQLSSILLITPISKAKRKGGSEPYRDVIYTPAPLGCII